MVPNRYYPVLASEDLKGKPVGIERLGQHLVLWRDEQGLPHAHLDRCPHRGVALSPGRVQGGELVCPYHAFRFGPDGACRHMPCEGEGAHIPGSLKLRSFDVKEAHGLLFVWWGSAEIPEDERPAPAWFDELPGSTSCAWGSSIDWPIPYVRTLESNFDLHHAAVVHRGIIPSRLQRVVGIDVHDDGDDGFGVTGRLTPPHPKGDDDGVAFRIQFRAPTTTLISLGRLRFIVADCPIDEERTWRYARYYQDWLPIPGVGKLLAFLLVWLEWSVVQRAQDLPIVLTQRPRHHEPGCDALVRADAGIARYLKLRRRLVREALAGPALPPAVLAGLGQDVQPLRGPRALPVVEEERRAHA